MKKIKFLISILLIAVLLCASLSAPSFAADIAKPTAAEVSKLFANSEYNGVHPRILADSSDFDYFRSEFGTGSMVDGWIEDIISEADSIIPASVCTYKLTGSRLNAVSQKVLARLCALGFAYQVTQNSKYAERAFKEMKSVAGFTNWNPSHFLDTAEMTFAMAIGYDWCYSYLSGVSGALSTVETAIIEKGLKEGKKQYDGEGSGTIFTTLANNWVAVCNGSLAIGALTVMEANSSLCTEIIEKSLADISDVLPEYAPDGGWEESVGYGEYATEYLCRMTDSLQRVLGTDFGIMTTDGLSNYARSRIYMDGSTADFNYHDDAESQNMSPVVMWLANYYNHPEITSHYLYIMEKYNLDGDVWTCLSYDRSSKAKVGGFPLDAVTNTVEAGTMRSSYEGTDGAYLAYHGGKKAGVSHYHNDVGSFVYDMMGVRWASDLGAEPLSYSLSGGVSMEELYRIRAEGHNTIVINPDESAGQLVYGCDAQIIESKSGASEAYQILDMTSAYTNSTSPSSVVSRVERGYKLTDNRRSLVVRDEITLKQDAEIYWFMHTVADVSVDSFGETAYLTIDNKKMQLDWFCEPYGAGELTVMDAAPLDGISPNPDGQADNSAYKKLAIKVNGTSDSPVSISVRLTPADEEYSGVWFSCDALDVWKVSDDALIGETPSYVNYPIHHELFDMTIDNYKSMYSPKYIDYKDSENNKVATIAAHLLNGQTVLSTQKGFGSKAANDNSLVMETTAFSGTTRNDPFVSITAANNQKGTFTIEFDYYADSGSATTVMQLLDSANKKYSFLTISASGAVSTATGALNIELERGKWHEFAITSHPTSGNSDLYINGRCVARGISTSVSLCGLKIIALYPTDGAASYSGTFAYDNVRIYSGEQEKYFTVFYDANGEETSSLANASEVYFNLANRGKNQAFMAVYDSDENGTKTLTGLTSLGRGGEGRHAIGANGFVKIIFVENTDSLTPTVEAIALE